MNPLVSQKAAYRQSGFVIEFDPSGTNILFSSFLGGHAPYTGGYAGTGVYSAANAIANDAQGSLYVSGYTTEVDFPSTLPVIGKGVPGGTLPKLNQFAFVLKIAPGGKNLVFSRLLGGVQAISCQLLLNEPNPNTAIGALAVSTDGTIVLGGNSNASDFLAYRAPRLIPVLTTPWPT